ncbi:MULTISPECIES: metallophosphoesterase [Streptomyces]|uniref:Metallophosphoesterase n=1 Tax=Streptomyces glycanivorans TaxID=3033808 RepID=A0ABY9JK17_9ACTN|nr:MULTISPECIES: metallophosphoesterase [unclassified Streptomyces]WSQ81402.1 metallophosphoesterase [Streptomyces sp. NBC_01213]TXS10672.1 metallophosphoesterase [Streptomyces sp. wa22]WLQ68047.1 metallophosphoesterase [Streptomyces sp. Alt3]WSQ88729.1 metallophosphoesterase [Streptomyces sp. NBC_01212]WSR05266.1 metallophosphoesterase [Streptomyces sp. NBC_01208]
MTETDNARSAASEAEAAPRSRLQRLMRYIPLVAPVLLWAVPCWVLLHTGQHWPFPVTPIGTALFALGLIGMPLAMARGHGRRQQDRAAIVGDTLLGSIWILFTWSVLLGVLLRLTLTVAGVGDGQDRARIVTWAVVGVAAVLLAWGYVEARRVPRVRRLDVRLPRLGAGLDGTRVALITDTHYGPLDRARWSERVCEKVNTLEADLVCHTGDIADGTAERRRAQAAPLGTVQATRARVYVTGNHEYYSEAQGWVDLMDELGWEPLRNRHLLLERGGDTLVVAGVDDVTAESSGLEGHRAHLAGALDGADPDLPVLLLAHQPKFIDRAAAHGVDLQLSGHTHGGQIWPFHHLVRLDQPALAGLSHHGARTLLYTSRGTGFWGPPFRVFAPSEITLLVLRSPQQPA